MTESAPDSKPPETRVLVLEHEPGALWIGSWHNVGIAVWLQPATAALVQRMAKAADTLVGKYPQGASSVHIIAPTGGLPHPDGRRALTDLLKARSEQFGCLAVVLERGGFWASALRAFVTGMRMVAPRTFSLRLHTDLDEVAEWLPEEHQQRTGVQIDPQELKAALAVARQMAEP